MNSKNSKLTKISCGLFLSILVMCSAASASASQDDVTICNDLFQNAKTRLDSCTRVINNYSDKEDDLLAKYYSTRGDLHRKLNNLDKSIADYTESIRIDSKYAITYFTRGAVYEDLGKSQLALQDYNTAIKLDGRKAFFYGNRASYYYGSSEFEKAISDLDVAIRLDPKFSSYWSLRGLCYMKKKKFSLAVTDFETALRLNPDNKTASNKLPIAKAMTNKVK